MKKKLILFLYFCFQICFSQNNTNAKLIDNINKLFLNNPDLCEIYSHKLLKISKNQGNKIDEGIACVFLADLKNLKSQSDSSYYYYDKAIQIAVEINDKKYELIFKTNKAMFLSERGDFNGALNLYNECIELAKDNNNWKSLKYLNIRKASILYEVEKYSEALKIFKKGLKIKELSPFNKEEIHFNLSKTYLKLSFLDSAKTQILQGLKIAKSNKHYDFEINFQNQLAVLHIYKRQYTQAEKILDKILPFVNKYNVIEYKRITLINKAKVHTLKNEHIKSIDILKNILITEKKDPLLTEKKAEIHNILAENYKQIGDTKNASLYLEKYIEDSKKIGQKKIETIEYLNNLNINEIEQEKASLTSQKWILICSLGTLCMLFGYYIYKRRKSDQQKFDFLIQKIEKYETDLKLEEKTDSNDIHLNQHSFTNLNNNPQESTTTNNDKIINQSLDIEEIEEDIDNIELLNSQEEIKEENISGFIIKDEKINEILDGLIKLEEKKYFLKQECTLHTVAKKLKTNTAYLSKIINNELGKSFSTYINELRINYIIVELKNNSKLRSYSVNAIAIEIGYKRPDAFTKYFKEATGLTPAIYIKKINQMNKN